MASVYGDYTRDRVGMFFGLTGVQLGILVAAGDVSERQTFRLCCY